MANIKTTYFLDRKSFRFLRDDITVSLLKDERSVEVSDHGTLYRMTVDDVAIVSSETEDGKSKVEHIEFGELMFLPGHLTSDEFSELKFIVEKFFLKCSLTSEAKPQQSIILREKTEIAIEKVATEMVPEVSESDADISPLAIA